MAIERLGKLMSIRIAPDYHRLRFYELELMADYLVKKQEEKEAERERRAALRDQQKAAAEMKAALEKLRKEQDHYKNLIAKLDPASDPEAYATAQAKLTELGASIDGVEQRAANIRTGHVYVISNFGAFGPDMVKIGMTRRLDPYDRVVELGDASVPFRFDVHAMVFHEDAVTLETHLHQAWQRGRPTASTRGGSSSTPPRRRSVGCSRIMPAPTSSSTATSPRPSSGMHRERSPATRQVWRTRPTASLHSTTRLVTPCTRIWRQLTSTPTRPVTQERISRLLTTLPMGSAPPRGSECPWPFHRR
jgi:hypothetical protein